MRSTSRPRRRSHKEYVLAAAAAGKPVYVEKPMALNAAECDEMIAACRAAGVPLWVAYYRRGLPKFLAVRDLLAEGAIGEVRFARILLQRVPVPEGGRPGDPHLALRARGVGRAATCSTWAATCSTCSTSSWARCRRPGHRGQPDRHVPGGGLGRRGAASSSRGCSAWACGTRPRTREEDVIELVGSQGTLRFSCFDPSPITLIGDGRTRTIEAEHPAHVHQPLIQTIVDELNGTGRCPSTGESGARTTRVIDAILAGYRTVKAGAGSVTPTSASCSTIWGWIGTPATRLRSRACQPRSPGYRKPSPVPPHPRQRPGAPRPARQRLQRDELLDVDGEQELAAARVDPRRRPLPPISWLSSPPASAPVRSLHHQRQPGPLVLPHRQDEPRRQDRGRVAGRVALRVQPPARGRGLALARIRADLADRGLAHRYVKHDRIEAGAAGRGRCASGLLASTGRFESQPSMLGMALVVQMPIMPSRAAWYA